MIDYDFCRAAKLTAEDLITWLDLEDQFLDGCCWNWNNRNMQIVGENAIRVSCELQHWDRWANSEEEWYDLTKPAQRRAFVNWIEDQRNEH